VNEGRTTLIFAAIAAVSLGLAWMSKPEAISDESDLKKERTGQPVFVKFEDPSEAASFQIIKYDEELGQLERFEVAKDKTSGMWKLPSYDDYPADAAEQVRDATTPLISLPILDVPSLDRGDHSLYGVVDPDQEGLTVGETGVGMLLRVKDQSDQVLAELVVGKEVEGAEGQRYVRIPSEDAVYMVELSTDPFTTEFQKWINKELLDVRSFDIASIGLRDYAIVPTQQGYGMSRNFDADLSFDSAANKWSLERLLTYESGGPQEVGLKEGEELQETALNDLRNAIQDLQIVDVRRKPTGLAADLKADKSLMENKESLQSLVSQGFIPQESPAGTEIFATGGETLVGTQNGVKYLLRFGEVVTKLSGSEDEESGLNRYLLVSAVLDDAKFPPPDLEPLPETVEEMLAMQQAEEAGETPPSTVEASGDMIPTAPELPSATDPTDVPESTPPAPSEPAEPATTEPEATDPGTTTQSPSTEPATTEPATTEPATTEPATTEPATTEPATTEPATTDPATTDPATTDPATTEPATSEPASGQADEPAASESSSDATPGEASEETPPSESPDAEEALNSCAPQEQEAAAGDEPAADDTPPQTDEAAATPDVTPPAGETAEKPAETPAEADDKASAKPEAPKKTAEALHRRALGVSRAGMPISMKNAL
jgi:hypothetical protein